MFTYGPAVTIHCVGIMLIYLCQGLVQGTIGLVPMTLIHLNKSFSTATIGLLGLPIYAFSLKFLWAPIVDIVHLFRGGGVVEKSSGSSSSAAATSKHKFLHRRLQWVIVTHLCMAGGYWYLFCLATTTNMDDTPTSNIDSSQSINSTASDSTTSSTTSAPTSAWSSLALENTSLYGLVVILGILCFSSSTQDVAVDAWAVEGLRSDLQGLAGSLQTIGLLVGSLLTTIFLNFHTSTADGLDYPVSIYFAVCGVICVLGIVAGAVVSWKVPLHRECSAADGSLAEIKSFLGTSSVRDFVVLLITKGIGSAANAIASYELIRLNWTTTNLSSSLSLINTILALVTAMFIVPKVLTRWTPAVVIRHLTGAFLVIQAISFGIYISAVYFGMFGLAWGEEADTHTTSDDAATTTEWQSVTATLGQQTFYYYAVSIPQTIVGSVVGTVLFVAVSGQIARESAPFPTVTGTAVTVLNSIGNMGGSLPSSAVMFGFPPLQEFLGIERSALIVYVVAGFLALGVVVRYKYLLPAINRLIDRERQVAQKISKAP